MSSAYGLGGGGRVRAGSARPAIARAAWPIRNRRPIGRLANATEFYAAGYNRTDQSAIGQRGREGTEIIESD